MHKPSSSILPLVRISTCGHLNVEVFHEDEPLPDGRVTFAYKPPIITNNGGGTALNLLKLLVSQPGRFATKDWLTETLRRNKSGDEEELVALVRLDNIISLLRTVLSSGGKQLGKMLVEYVPPTPDSGSGYRLAPYPLIWLDVEAISTHVQRACQMQIEGNNPWAEWNAVYQLANAGPFLAEGWYSDWALTRREEVEGYLWQSVQGLWRQAVKLPEKTGEEEALRLLREYWLRHPENEDAFQPLVELLGTRGDYQRAERYYAKLCGILNEEGKEPDGRTQKIMNFLRSCKDTALHGLEDEDFAQKTQKVFNQPRARSGKVVVANTKKPNEALRYHRLQRGWSQQKVAEEIGEESEMVRDWERGYEKTSPFYQEKLCALFGLNAEQLGFLLPVPSLVQKTQMEQEQPKAVLVSLIDENNGKRELEESQTLYADEDKKPHDEWYQPYASLLASPRPSSCPHIWNVPYQRNPFFTGRDDVLAHLHEMLNRENFGGGGAPQALCGLGGIGKTQTVLEYLYRYESEYQAVFWIKADTRENLYADFLSLAQLLVLPERDAQDQMVVTTAIQRWLREHTGWLLVFDNVDDLEVVREILPTGYQGHMLLTTRAQATGRIAHRLEIEEMDQRIGALFLLRRAGIIDFDASLEDVSERNRVLAGELVQELGGLPLALDQAGAYIEETASSLLEYIHLYQKRRHALLKRRGGLTNDHPEPVATTWALSFHHIEQRDQLAAELLRLFAFLDPDGIPEEIMSAYVIQTMASSHKQENEWEHFRVNEALEVLLRFSLVQRCTETQTVMIHRLVQAAIQDSMETQEQHLWRENVTQIVHHTFPHTSTLYSTSGHPYSAVQLLRVSIYKDQVSGNKKNLAAEHWKLAVQQQVIGKLKASEHSLLEGLSLCHEIADQLNEAKTHQYLALLRAYQGLFPASFHHLDVATSLFRDSRTVDAESTLAAYQALCALLAGDIQSALLAAQRSWNEALLFQNERDLIRAQWILGNVLVCLSLQEQERGKQNRSLQYATTHLEDALKRCQTNHIVDYEADLLLAWARLHAARGDKTHALRFATEALVIADRSTFRLLSADIHLILSQIASGNDDKTNAKIHAQAAFNHAFCDSAPYWYQSTARKAKRVLDIIQ